MNLSPRKLPTQRRSLETVEAIIQASAQILSNEGYDKLSTNRIAERAGVSIGSVYQYFPNKDSILSFLVDQYIEKQANLVQSHLEIVQSHNIETYTRSLIQALYQFRMEERDLQKAVIGQLPKFKFSERLMQTKLLLAQIMAQVLGDKVPDQKAVPLEHLFFVIIQGVDAMIDGLVFGPYEKDEIDHPKLLEEILKMSLNRVL